MSEALVNDCLYKLRVPLRCSAQTKLKSFTSLSSQDCNVLLFFHGTALIQDLAEATEQRVVIHKELERLRKHAKRKRFDGFSCVQRRTALILYIMGDFDKRPAVFYLLRLMRMRLHDATEADKEGLLHVTDEWFLACNDAEVDSFMHETLPGDAALFKRARSILNDHAVRDWVFSMNVCKGLAPACRDVATNWDMILEESIPAVGDHHASHRHNLSVSRNRQFFIRWRFRMAIKMGKIHTREAFTRPQIAAKVAVA